MEINKESRIINKNKYISLTNDENGTNIELSIYNFTINYIEENEVMLSHIQNIYDEKNNEIYNYLINDTSQFLINALKNNKINSLEIAFLSPDELNPQKYEKIITSKNNKIKIETEVGSTAFTCSKCKVAKCKVTQKQTRAGDEAPTTFVKCLECGHSFKF